MKSYADKTGIEVTLETLYEWFSKYINGGATNISPMECIKLIEMHLKESNTGKRTGVFCAHEWERYNISNAFFNRPECYQECYRCHSKWIDGRHEPIDILIGYIKKEVA